MVLYQIHHQSIKDPSKTKICFQFEAANMEEIRKAVSDAWERCPPPRGYQFVIPNEESELFDRTALIKDGGTPA